MRALPLLGRVRPRACAPGGGSAIRRCGRAARLFSPALALAVALASQLLPPAQPAPGQAAITFAVTRWQNLFPAGITLESQASSATTIVTTGLTCALQGSPAGAQRVSLPVQPGREVSLRYTWDARPAATPPGAVFVCRWDAADSTGSQASSEAATFTYEDTRFRWQVRSGDGAAVWWHDAGDSAAGLALDLANRAIEHQRRVFQATLPGRIRVMLYNSQAELAAWQPALPAFRGGGAFPGLGVTAQVARPGPGQAAWLAAVIPHEISRLYFYQATAGAAAAPAWLDEGLALYNETGEHRDEQSLLQAAVLRRGLLPLAGLAPALAGSDEGRVRLAQAEALSAVNYLMYRHGPGELSALLAAFRAGLGMEAAFTTALGGTPAEFEDEWLMWVGVPAAWRQGQATPGAAAVVLAAATPAGPPQPAPPGQPGPAGPALPDTSRPTMPPVALLVAIILAALILPALATRKRS